MHLPSTHLPSTIRLSILFALMVFEGFASSAATAFQDSNQTGVILRRRTRNGSANNVQSGSPTPAMPERFHQAKSHSLNDSATSAVRRPFEPFPTHVVQESEIELPHPSFERLPAQRELPPSPKSQPRNPTTISDATTVEQNLGPLLHQDLPSAPRNDFDLSIATVGDGCLQYRNMVSVDGMFLKYRKQGGVAVGIDVNPGDDRATFDMQFAPRVTLRHAIDNKYHVKARYFFFDKQQATNINPNSFVDVETFSLDGYFGRKFCLGRGTTLEVEAGGRWMEFREDLFDNNDVAQLRQWWTKQVGISFGGQLNKRLRPGFSLYFQGHITYGRGDYQRFSSGFQNDLLNSFNSHTYEVSTGFQFDRRTNDGSNLFLRAGFELMNFQNLGSGFDNGNDETLAGFRDIDLTGFGFQLGWQR